MCDFCRILAMYVINVEVRLSFILTRKRVCEDRMDQLIDGTVGSDLLGQMAEVCLLE